jgi:hypothetical protein
MNDSKNRTSGVGFDVIVQPPGSSFLQGIGGAPVSVKIADVLRRMPHVKVVSPVVWQIATGGGVELIDGIDLQSFEAMGGPFQYIKGGPFQGGGRLYRGAEACEGRRHHGDLEPSVPYLRNCRERTRRAEICSDDDDAGFDRSKR